MTRFTVLGGGGQIGSRLAAHLRSCGHDVAVPARGDSSVLIEPLGHVIYAIGVTADFRTRPIATVQAHVCVLAEVLARATFDSLLYLSSTRVYGGEEPVDEATPLIVRPADPSDLYNLSKLTGESLCLHGGREGVRVARLSNVIGADDAGSPNFLPSLMREARAGLIRLRSDLTSAKDYIHVDDVVALLSRIALHGRHSVYNVASGRNISHREWVEEFCGLYGCKVEVAFDAPVLRFPPIDIQRISEEFGFRPTDALRRIVREEARPLACG